LVGALLIPKAAVLGRLDDRQEELSSTPRERDGHYTSTFASRLPGEVSTSPSPTRGRRRCSTSRLVVA